MRIARFTQRKRSFKHIRCIGKWKAKLKPAAIHPLSVGIIGFGEITAQQELNRHVRGLLNSRRLPARWYIGQYAQRFHRAPRAGLAVIRSTTEARSRCAGGVVFSQDGACQPINRAAEALISGLAIVLSGHIPGQEEGNVPFVVDNGVGEYSEDPEEIARIVARWFGPERGTLSAKETKAKSLGHPQATFDICRSIVETLLA